jgi:uncharacterized protein
VTALLDSNVIIALLRQEHVHHSEVERWFGATTEPVATCPITQGAFLRVVLQRGESADNAVQSLRSLTTHRRHRFWADDLGYDSVRIRGVIGHRQVTDAYLAQLARERGERVATIDRGFEALHADVAELVPVAGRGQ